LKPGGTPDCHQSQQNQTIRFAKLDHPVSTVLAGASRLYSFHVATHFGDSAGESMTSSMSSMKGGNSSHNGSDLDNGNILKPTFDTLMEEGRKVFEVCHAILEELFLSRFKVTQQGLVLKDTTPIIFTKPEVIPKVRPNPSSSLNDIQHMNNSALERQAKSIDELLRRLIEEWDGEKYSHTNVNPSSSTWTVNFAQTNTHTSGPSVGGTTMPNPSAQLVNHSIVEPPSRVRLVILGCHNKLWLTYMDKGTRTPHLPLLYQILIRSPIPSGLMVEPTLTLAATSKPHTPSLHRPHPIT
jgi:hypothetical protein